MKSAPQLAQDKPSGPVAQPQAAQQVSQLLRNGPYPQLDRCVACHFREGVLTLRGRVPSYYLKQFAQTVAAKVHGVQAVQNEVIVEP